MGRKRAKMKRRVKIILSLLGMALVIFLVVLLVMRVRRGVIDNDTMTFSQNGVEVVIIRDEAVITGEAYGKMSFNVDEGQLVEGNEKVAQVYKWGYNENLIQDLVTLQQTIKEYQTNTLRKDISDPEYNELETQIHNLLNEISEAMKHKKNYDILNAQRELSALLDQRREHLLQFQPDGKLSEMLEQEEKYIDMLKEWRSDILAKQAGIISFYYDQYESLLNKSTLEQLSFNDLQSVKRNKKPEIVSNDSTVKDRPLYRLINPDLFYVVVNSNSFPMVLDEVYQISFEGYYDQSYEGKVISVTTAEQGSVYILQVDADVRPFSNMRTAKVDLQTTFSGLKVPKRAVKYQEQQPGIHIENGDILEFIPIEILTTDKDDILFRDPNGRLLGGMNYVE